MHECFGGLVILWAFVCMVGGVVLVGLGLLWGILRCWVISAAGEAAREICEAHCFSFTGTRLPEVAERGVLPHASGRCGSDCYWGHNHWVTS